MTNMSAPQHVVTKQYEKEAGRKHALLEKVLFILDEVEHSGFRDINDELILHCCPLCSNYEVGHTVNCRLAELMDEVREELKNVKA